MRKPQDIKATGAPWVTEPELAALCDQVEQLQTATYFALEELSKFPEIANVEFQGEFDEGGDIKTYTLPPYKLTGVFEALRKQVAEVMPAAKECVEWWYQRERVKCELDHLRTRTQDLEQLLEDQDLEQLFEELRKET